MSDSALAKLSWAEWSLVKLGRGVLHSAKGLFLLAIGVVFLQTLKYLQTGEWPDWSVFNILGWVFPAPFMDWLLYPQNWFGLHKIVSWFVRNCPIAVFMVLIAGVWFGGGVLALEALFKVVEQDSDDDR